MGIGVNNLIFVKTNKHGQMDVHDLQTKILTAQAEVSSTRVCFLNGVRF